MRKIRVIQIAFLIAILLLIMGNGCSGITSSTTTVFPVDNADNAAGSNLSGAVNATDTVSVVPAQPSFFDFPIPEASGLLVEKNQNAEVDFSNTADGYVMVRFIRPTEMNLRVQITGPSGVVYTYFLNQRGDFEVFPLSDGDGAYTVGVFEQIEGNKFATAIKVEIDVALTDEFAPFLRPNQYINFNRESAIVRKAAELVGGVSGFFEKVNAIYTFVINNITYDIAFAEAVLAGGHIGYISDIDDVLARGKGICLDYAALMTGMLRSQGIPTKLVVGYAGDVYHAWISVFSAETGWVNNIITFDGNDWNLMDPTFASSGNQSAEVMQFIGDGANYRAMFFY